MYKEGTKVMVFMQQQMTSKERKLFKHLGVVVSSDLSWSNHITSICAKAKRILGLLYRKYYNHVEGMS